MSRVVPVIPPVYWKGVIKDFIYFKGLYGLFSAVEGFMYFFNYFGLIDFFYLSLRDFLN